MRFLRCALVVQFVLLAPGARADDPLIPPVDAVIVRQFDEPQKEWGRGHRGIDYVVPQGAPVRSAGAGAVTFAGTVAGEFYVTIDHGNGLETTYSQLSEISVRRGDSVGEGTWIGLAGYPHEGREAGLHFGVKVDGGYVDPLLHLVPLDASAAIALAPLDEALEGHERTCNESADIDEGLPPPNRNVVVVVGGITSSTASPPELFETVSKLGYAEDHIVRFSYRGAEAPDLHEPYEPADTFEDIRSAAHRLKELLTRVAVRYPGLDVDLVAHSQGGLVARAYLAELAEAWDPALPRVQHLVTFASPHQGAPSAGEIDELRRGPVTSRILAAGLDLAPDIGAPIPPVDSGAVRQLRPGSDLLTDLAQQDVSFGTRVLALSIPNDIVVPAGRAAYPGKPSRTVPSHGLFGHGAIQRSPRALQIARAFLAGAGAACPPELGVVDSRLGAIVDFGQRVIGEAINGVGAFLPF